MNNKPNFFIVGAPKCGTTALSHYLSQHPNIFFCTPKEPHYFADDFDGHRAIKKLAAYLNLFKNVKAGQTAIGEGSVLYLYSKNAAENIYQFDPKAKIIVMLRNPVDLVASLHQQYLHALYEDEVDFKKAWDLQNSRQRGLNIPRLCRQPELLMYSEIGKLGDQVEQLLLIFPKEQIKFIIFDDFVKNTPQIYSEVLSFLEVHSEHFPIFEKVNEAQVLKSGLIGLLVRNCPVFLRDLVTQMRFNKHLMFMPAIADKLFKKSMKRPPLSIEMQIYLRNYFRADVEKLEQLTFRNLEKWKSDVE